MAHAPPKKPRAPDVLRHEQQRRPDEVDLLLDLAADLVRAGDRLRGLLCVCLLAWDVWVLHGAWAVADGARV